MIGIIAAMEKELSELRRHIENPETRTISGVTFHSGKISGKEVVAAVCGIGKVNAAVCAESMILSYPISAIINTGVAGALTKELRVCDIVAADCAIQHDVDTTALGDAPGFVSTVNTIKFPTDERLTTALINAIKAEGLNGLSGAVATGDQFISRAEQKARIKELFGCVACEMEGGAIAQVCLLNKVPCAILRAISDGADEGAFESYAAFADKAAHNSARALLRYLSQTED